VGIAEWGLQSGDYCISRNSPEPERINATLRLHASLTIFLSAGLPAVLLAEVHHFLFLSSLQLICFFN